MIQLGKSETSNSHLAHKNWGPSVLDGCGSKTDTQNGILGWKQGLKPAVPCWFDFEPYPHPPTEFPIVGTACPFRKPIGSHNICQHGTHVLHTSQASPQ